MKIPIPTHLAAAAALFGLLNAAIRLGQWLFADGFARSNGAAAVITFGVIWAISYFAYRAEKSDRALEGRQEVTE